MNQEPSKQDDSEQLPNAGPSPFAPPCEHPASVDVEITRAALDALRQHIQDGGCDLETGGVLLGHETTRGWRILVAGGPGPRAERHPLSFRRDLTHAQRLADDAWDRYKAVWLGEWHTHPFAPPIPSDLDMTSYTAHLNDAELGFDRFLSIIVGHPESTDEGDAAPVSDPAGPSSGSPSTPPVSIAIAWVIDDQGATTAPLRVAEEIA